MPDGQDCPISCHVGADTIVIDLSQDGEPNVLYLSIDEAKNLLAFLENQLLGSLIGEAADTIDVAEAAMSHEAARRLLATLESLLATEGNRDLGGDDIEFSPLEANRSGLGRVNWKKDGF